MMIELQDTVKVFEKLQRRFKHKMYITEKHTHTHTGSHGPTECTDKTAENLLNDYNLRVQHG